MIRINATIPDRLLSKLDEEAAQLEMSRSELLRRVLDDHFNQKPLSMLSDEQRALKEGI